MFFKIICILLLWKKVASALEVLNHCVVLIAVSGPIGAEVTAYISFISSSQVLVQSLRQDVCAGRNEGYCPYSALALQYQTQ